MKLTDKTNLLMRGKKKYPVRPISAITSIAIHHSATKEGSAEAFARYHVIHNKWPGIGYHYVVNKDGSVVKTNKHETKSYHVGNSNRTAIGICLVGNFTVEEPTKEQLQSTAEVCKILMELITSIREIKGHSDYPGYSWKMCPAFDVKKITDIVESMIINK